MCTMKHISSISNFISKYSIYGIFLLIFFIPLTHKTLFSIYDPDLLYSRYILIFLSVLGVFVFLLNFKKFINDPIFLFLVTILGFYVLSIFKSQSQIQSIRMTAFMSAIVFLYPTLKQSIDYKKDNIGKIILIMILAYLFTLVFWVTQYYLFNYRKVLIGGIWPLYEIHYVRYGSSFWDVNHYGIYLASSFFVFTSYFLSKLTKLKRDKRKYLKLLTYIFIPISMLVLLFLTKSRSAFIGFFFGLLLYLFLLIFAKHRAKIGKQKIGSLFYLIVGFLSVVIPFSLISLIQNKLHYTILYRSMSMFAHLYLIKIGIIAGTKNFLTGIGANAFDSYMRTSEYADAYYFIDPAAKLFKLPLHSLWLEVYTEVGALAFIVYLSFWAFLLLLLINRGIKYKDYLSIGFASAIVTFLVGGLVYSYKAEFLWIIVLTAAAYILSKYNTKNLKQFYINLKNEVNFKYSYVLYSALIIIAFLITFVNMFTPLSVEEIRFMDGLGSCSNFGILQFICMVLDKQSALFRYVFGNYSYTVRLISLIYFIGSAILLFGYNKRRLSTLNSLLYTGVILFAVNAITGSLLSVNFVWVLLFLMMLILSIIFVAIDFLEKYKKLPDTHQECSTEGFTGMINKYVNNSKLLGMTLVILVIFSVVHHSVKYSKYSDDETFVLELVYNKGLDTYSNVIIQNGAVDKELVNYYFTRITRKNDKYVYSGMNVNYANIDNDWYGFDLTTKEVFIGKSPVVIKLGKDVKEDIEKRKLKNRVSFAVVTYKTLGFLYHEVRKVKTIR